MVSTSPRIRVREVSQLMGCSVSTVWSWVRRGLLPEPHRVGTRFSYWIRSEIEALAVRGHGVTPHDAGGGHNA